MRALFDEDRGRIYCVVHAEKLSHLVAEKAMDILKLLSQGRKCMYLFQDSIKLHFSL